MSESGLKQFIGNGKPKFGISSWSSRRPGIGHILKSADATSCCSTWSIPASASRR